MTAVPPVPTSSSVGSVALRAVCAVGLLLVSLPVAAALWSAAGWWNGATAAVSALVLAALALRLCRLLPAWGVPRPPALATVGLGVLSAGWLAVTTSQQVLPRRDAGSNLQATIALVRRGFRILPVDLQAIGGAATLRTRGLSLESPAFYWIGGATGPRIQPQFPVGVAADYSLGYVVGGVTGAAVIAAVCAGITVTAVGLLGVRFAGWWGVLASATCATAFPLVHSGRATYSEPLSTVTLGAGLLALVAAMDARAGGRRASVAGVVAGTLVGGTAMVRIDALRETMLVALVVALLSLQHSPVSRPLARGLVASTLGSVALDAALSWRYLGSIWRSLVPLVAMLVVVLVVCAVTVRLGRRGRRLPMVVAARLDLILAGTAALGAVVLGSRPLWQSVHQSAADPGSRLVASLQQAQGLPVDGGRTYAEHSVAWLSWWLGVPSLVLAAAALVGLALAAGRGWNAGRLPVWAAPAIVGVGSTVLTLWRPGITPDHPWADRRLVIAIPTVALLAVAALRFLGRRAGSVRFGAGAVAVIGTLAVLGPTVTATWPHASERVEAGSSGAVASVCGALRPGDVVLTVDSRGENEWPEVVRGQCGHESIIAKGWLREHPDVMRADVAALAARVRASGHRLVLLAADGPEAIRALGPVPDEVAHVEVQEDQRLLTRAPRGLSPLAIDVWLAPAP